MPKPKDPWLIYTYKPKEKDAAKVRVSIVQAAKEQRDRSIKLVPVVLFEQHNDWFQLPTSEAIELAHSIICYFERQSK